MTNPQVGVIFDCDGTLVDSMAAWRELEEGLAEMAGGPLTQEHRDALTTMTIPECGAFFHDTLGIASSGAEVQAMIEEFMDNFYRNRAKAKPGALEFVQSLAELGVPMTVASSTPSELLRAGIASAGFAPYMMDVLSVDDVGASKRDPKLFRTCRDIMGTATSATWGFDDSCYALDTLRNNGFHSVGVYDCDISGTIEQLNCAADFTIVSFTELDGNSFLERASSFE